MNPPPKIRRKISVSVHVYLDELELIPVRVGMLDALGIPVDLPGLKRNDMLTISYTLRGDLIGDYWGYTTSFQLILRFKICLRP